MSIKSIVKKLGNKITPQGFREYCFALLLKYKYWRTICRLRKVYGKRKIVVAFCVSEIAKWKSQFLYDRLSQTDTYRPVILVYPSPLDFNRKESDVNSLLQDKIKFFAEKGMYVVNVWDCASMQCVIPEDARPDIVFYQQPWDTPPFPTPSQIADYALSFYVPYFLVNNLELKLETGQLLHRLVFGYIVQNSELAKLYNSELKKKHYAGRCLGLGHTIVDTLTTRIAEQEEDYVIYAPHFSFPITGLKRPVTYSSFLENGKLILEFAKQHPEIKWVFKPHPRLKYELKTTGGWSYSEVDAYYAEWAKVGIVCETPDYIEHFQRSSAMITDCGSFMTEYSCMDKPLIRLYYHKENLPPNPMLEKLYSTFYYAHNNNELADLLGSVICRREDPNQEERHNEVVRLGLNQGNTSHRIIDYLDKLLS